MNMAKEEWIQKQCAEVEAKLGKNNSKRACQDMNDLTQHR